MEKRMIRLQYRKLIDAGTAKPWEKHAFNDSYTEFLMQAQLYNREKKYTTFSELVTNVQGADKLHFLVSAAVTGHVQQLQGKLPDVVDITGKPFLPFVHYRFEIIQSDITNKAKHQIAIHFITEPVAWLDTIGNTLFISLQENNDELLTHHVTLQPLLAIYAIKKQTP